MDTSCTHEDALVSGRHQFVDVVLEVGRCRSCRRPLTRLEGGAWQEVLTIDPSTAWGGAGPADAHVERGRRFRPSA